MTYECIFAILERGAADKVMEDAKKAGAKGGTIFHARGTGAKEAKTFFGLTIESGREILMVLCETEMTDVILEEIIDSANLQMPGTGVAFVLPVTKIVGLTHREGIEISSLNDNEN